MDCEGWWTVWWAVQVGVVDCEEPGSHDLCYINLSIPPPPHAPQVCPLDSASAPRPQCVSSQFRLCLTLCLPCHCSTLRLACHHGCLAITQSRRCPWMRLPSPHGCLATAQSRLHSVLRRCVCLATIPFPWLKASASSLPGLATPLATISFLAPLAHHLHTHCSNHDLIAPWLILPLARSKS